jgi:hypothetical protein
MNASGKEHVADLLDMMKNAGLGDAAPAADAMMSPRMDMERLSSIMGKPEDDPFDGRGHEHFGTDNDEDDASIPGNDEVPGDDDSDEGILGTIAGGVAGGAFGGPLGALTGAAAGDSLTDDEELDMDEGQFKREMTDDAQQMDLIDFVDKYSDYGEEEASAMWHDMNEEAVADMDEGAVKNAMIDDAESMDKEDFCEKYMAQGMDRAECEEHWNSMNEAETEDMSSEGSYTVRVKGKDMAAQEELARLATLSGVSAPQEMETEASGDYENEPDEQYSDLSAVIPDGDDLHKKKKTHPATAGGDNPMAIENIKAALYAALNEKKKPDANGNGIPDYAEDGKGKNDTAKGKKPKKGQVPPQFQKGKKDTKTAEGRGRGKKTKLTAGRGRGK